MRVIGLSLFTVGLVSATGALAQPAETSKAVGASRSITVGVPEVLGTVHQAALGEIRIGSGAGNIRTPAPVISVGGGIIGAPVYFARSAGPGSATMIRMSSRPIRSARMTASVRPLISGTAMATAGVTSGFGMRRHPTLGGRRMHTGVDLSARAGTPVAAAEDGLVSRSEWTGGYGLLVALEHSAGRQTRYAHLSRLSVAPGQRVRKGEVIGYVGSTGRSTGPHLHFETRVNGRPVNPLR